MRLFFLILKSLDKHFWLMRIKMKDLGRNRPGTEPQVSYVHVY